MQRNALRNKKKSASAEKKDREEYAKEKTIYRKGLCESNYLNFIQSWEENTKTVTMESSWMEQRRRGIGSWSVVTTIVRKVVAQWYQRRRLRWWWRLYVSPSKTVRFHGNTERDSKIYPLVFRSHSPHTNFLMHHLILHVSVYATFWQATKNRFAKSAQHGIHLCHFLIRFQWLKCDERRKANTIHTVKGRDETKRRKQNGRFGTDFPYGKDDGSGGGRVFIS